MSVMVKTINGRSSATSHMNYAPAWYGRIKDVVVAVLYFAGAHLYDGLCYAVSNIFSYPRALAIMAVILFLLSLLLVGLHGLTQRRLGWDVIGLNGINRLKDQEDIPPHRIFKRLTRWTLRGGRWGVLVAGSIFIGPPVVALLLREEERARSTFFYLVIGTLLSVVFWVTVWSGVGQLTWNQYVLPLTRRIF